MIATGSCDGSVALWDLSTPSKTAPLYLIKLTTNPVRTLAWSPKSDFVLSFTTNEGDLIVVDIRDPFKPVTVRKGCGYELKWPVNAGGVLLNDSVSSRFVGVYSSIEEEETAVRHRSFVQQRVQSLSASYWHNLVVSGGLEGSVILASMDRIYQDASVKVMSPPFLRVAETDEFIYPPPFLEALREPQGSLHALDYGRKF